MEAISSKKNRHLKLEFAMSTKVDFRPTVRRDRDECMIFLLVYATPMSQTSNQKQTKKGTIT